MTQENKRRNLVGEGFEDVVAGVVGRLPLSRTLVIHSRTALHELPGFHAPAPNEKAKKVDLAFVRGTNRTLVSVKWSIRADREEQFQSDFETYARLESAGRAHGRLHLPAQQATSSLVSSRIVTSNQSSLAY